MNLNVHAIHFNTDSKLVELIEEKINKLSNINNDILDVDVYLKLENTPESIRDKVVEIKLNFLKRKMFAKETSKTFEESLDKALDSISEQIKKRKSKIRR